MGIPEASTEAMAMAFGSSMPASLASIEPCPNCASGSGARSDSVRARSGSRFVGSGSCAPHFSLIGRALQPPAVGYRLLFGPDPRPGYPCACSGHQVISEAMITTRWSVQMSEFVPASKASSRSRPRSPNRTRKAVRCATAASTSRTSSDGCPSATCGVAGRQRVQPRSATGRTVPHPGPPGDARRRAVRDRDARTCLGPQAVAGHRRRHCAREPRPRLW